MTTVEEVFGALALVTDPEIRLSIVALDFVRDVRVLDGVVSFTLASTGPTWPLASDLEAQALSAVRALPGVERADMNVVPLTEREQRVLAERLRPRAERARIPFADQAYRTRVLLIASGKGGVGKSSTTTNLAVTLAARGIRSACSMRTCGGSPSLACSEWVTPHGCSTRFWCRP